MASKGLGTLTLDLVLRMAGFERGMDKAQRTLDKRLRDMDRRAKAVGSAIGVSLGLSIAGALTGAVAGIKSAIDNMDQLRDASIRLGIGTETLSALRYAAQQTGTDFETLGKGLKIFAKNAAEALDPKSQKAKIFDALGIQIKDSAGNLRQLDALLPEVADKFKQLQDGTLKAALAQELFGKSGLELTEFLNQGADGLKTMMDRARELGVVIDKETADKADKFNDTLGDLKTATEGLAAKVAAELLPKLTELTQWAVDFVSDGDNAANIANSIADGFQAMADAAKLGGGLLTWLDSVRVKLGGIQQAMIDGNWITVARKNFQEQVWGQSGDWDINGFVANQQAAASAAAKRSPVPFGPQFQIPGVKQPFSAVPAVQDFSKYVSSTTNLKKLQDAFVTDSSKKHHGKSEAEKEAERLAKAINKMTDAQRDWQTELDGTGNKVADDYARRLADITEKAEDFTREGIPSDKVKNFREQMTKLAEALKEKETAEYLKEFGYQTEEMIANANGASTASIEYARAIDELNKALKSGIIGQDEYNKRAGALAEVRDASSLQVLRDIKQQQDQLGMTAEAQDTYNKLIYAGVDANSELGREIISANHALHEQAKASADQVEAMDALRDSARGFFRDLRDGAEEGKSAWDILKDAFDRFADALYDIIANNLVERVFGEQGSASGGSYGGGISSVLGSLFGAGGGTASSSVMDPTTGQMVTSGGGFWASLLSSFFGGGRAIGGPTSAGMFYRVNENGPELLSVGGRDYLMMGSQAGHITPNHALAGGGGFTQINNINYQAPYDPRVEAQKTARLSFEGNRNLARNR